LSRKRLLVGKDYGSGSGAVKKVNFFLQPRKNRGRETAIFARALRFLLQKQYKTQN
jgi:hypothetical protein